MALINCPECANRISDKAHTCPFCGCPAEFFISDSVLGKKGDNLSEEKQNEYLVSFYFDDNNFISLDIRDKVIFQFCGELYSLGIEKEGIYREKYINFGNIDVVIERFCTDIGVLINEIADKCVRFLFQYNINYTPESFFDKYSTSKKMLYQDYIGKVLDSYAEIYDEKEKMKEYRAAVKASRGKWQGGGFGIGGAIKGAITADLMNAGSGVLHSIGDLSMERKHNNIIKNKLQNLYNDINTKNIMCSSIVSCIELYIDIVFLELNNNGSIKSNIYISSMESEGIFNNIKHLMVKEGNIEKGIYDKNIQCICMYPFRYSYYEYIYDYLNSYYNENKLDNRNGFKEYLDFWNIGYINKKYELIYDKIFENIGELTYSDFDIIQDNIKWNFYYKFGENSAWYVFVNGDNYSSKRNICFPCNEAKVLERYGECVRTPFDKSIDYIWKYGRESNGNDTNVLEKCEYVLIYSLKSIDYNLSIRFYFDSNNELLLCGYLSSYVNEYCDGTSLVPIVNNNQSMLDSNDYIAFDLCGYKLLYPENTEELAKLFFLFDFKSKELVDELEKIYRKSKDIFYALSVISTYVNYYLDTMLEGCIASLASAQIIVSPEQLMKKYKIGFGYDYSKYIEVVLKEVFEIVGKTYLMEEYVTNVLDSRDIIRNWDDFEKGNVKNVLDKYSVIYSVLKKINYERISEEELSRLSLLFKKAGIHSIVVYSVKKCLHNIFWALSNYMYENDYTNVIILNIDYAMNLKYINDLEKGNFEFDIETCIKGIYNYPGEIAFYRPILDELTTTDRKEFIRFLDYWGMWDMFPDFKKEISDQVKVENEFSVFIRNNNLEIDLNIPSFNTVKIIKEIVESKYIDQNGNIKGVPKKISDYMREYYADCKNVFPLIGIIPGIYTMEHFFAVVRANTQLFDSSISKVWLIGDHDQEDGFLDSLVRKGYGENYPTLKIKKRVKQDNDRIIIFHDPSLFDEELNGGFCITERYIYDLQTMKRLSLHSLNKTEVIKDNDGFRVIVVGDGINNIVIKDKYVYGERFQDVYLLQAIIITYINRYVLRRVGFNDYVNKQINILLDKESGGKADYTVVNKTNGDNPEQSLTVYCPYCGNKISKDVNFCNYCGEKIL